MGCDVSATSDFPYESSVNLAIIFQFIIILFADILLGGGCIFVGCFLLYKGLTGNAIVIIEISTIKASVINCTPGMFLIMAGVVILYLNKFSVKLGTDEKKKNKKVLIPIIFLLIICAISLCIYGAYMANSNNLKWLQKA